MYTTDVSSFWSVLGSFWQNFENRAYVQEIWQNYYNVMSGLYYKANTLRQSIGFSRMEATIIDFHQSFNIIWEATNTNYSGLVNAITVSGTEGNRVEYYVWPGTISIPELTYYYANSGGTDSALQTLTEGTDYYIVDMERIRFVNDPPFIHNQNQPHFKGNTLLAEKVYKLNPALWGIEPLKVGLSSSTYRDSIYNAFVSGYATDSVERDLVDAEHFKHLVWGLQTGTRSRPTISNIKNLYGMGRGLPFAHNSGILASGIISGVDKTYSISGYNVLSFTNSGAYIDTNYPLFGNDDQIYDFVAKFSGVSTENLVDITTNNTKLVLRSVDGEINITVDPDGVVPYELLYSNIDVTKWHKYTIKFPDTDTALCYIDDTLIGSGTLNSAWNGLGASNIYYVFGITAVYNLGLPPAIISDHTVSFRGELAQIKIRDLENNVKFYFQSVPITSLTQTTFEDLSNNNYSITVSGTTEFSETTAPLICYTTYNSEDSIPQFKVLLPGVQVYDYINNQEVVSGLIDYPEEQYSRLYIYDTDLLYKGTLSYDEEYLTDLMDNYIPASTRYAINPSGYSGIFLAPWGNDSTGDGSRQNPVNTFTKAASLSSGFSNIWFRSGTYFEPIKTSLVSGTGSSWANPFKIGAFPGESVTLVSNTELEDGIIQFDKTGSNYISVENFDINGQGRSQLLVNMAVSGAQFGQVYGCNLYNVISGAVTNMAIIEEKGHKIKRCTINPGSWQDITGVKVTKNSTTGAVPTSGMVSYCEISNCDKGIFVTGPDITTPYYFAGHHNYLHNNTIGTQVNHNIYTYLHNNLIEECGWGIALGYGAKTLLPSVVNNTIKNCVASGTHWKTYLGSGIGIRMGTKQFLSAGNYDYCQAGQIFNNAVSECNIAYYDPSGLADVVNFNNVHKNNVCDDGSFPSSGYTSANTNLSGIIFHMSFQTASSTKDYKLHPYFSSGYSYGTNLALFTDITSLEDINIDYSGVTRIGYSGWDAGAFENLA